MGDTFFLVGVVVALLIAAVIAYYLMRAARAAQNAVSQVTDILDEIKEQEVHYAQTPKSVSAMTPLELPRVLQDFPEFHWPQWKQTCEQTLRDYLEALEHRDPSLLKNAPGPLRAELIQEIESAAELGKTEKFDDIRVHRTEIARYERKKGLCTIKVQSSVGYIHSRKGDPSKPDIQEAMEQERYDMELFYVQDPVQAQQYASMFHMNCPNCGAAITSLGQKECEYCGTAVEPINLRVWMLHNIRLVK